MKVRVISALAGLVILAVVLLFFDTLLFNAVIAALSVIAVFELLKAAACEKILPVRIFAFFASAAMPFSQEPFMRSVVPPLMFVLVFSLFAMLLKKHRSLRIEQVAMAFFFSMLVPLFFSSAVFIRNNSGTVAGCLYLLWALGAAWLSDTGAYFTGRAFGRRKLAPVVSPTKTVEGAVGGVAVSCVFMLLIAWGYQLLMARLSCHVHIDYTLMLLLTPVFSVAGIVGDLSASVIKRQFGVKDYGHIMPGHGGLLDRFDSALFTMPAVFIISRYIVVIAAP